MPRIAVVSTAPPNLNGLHACLREARPDLPIVPPDKVPDGLDAVLMRCPFETELNSPVLLQAVAAEKKLRKSKCSVINPVMRVMAAQRKDFVYTVLRAHGIPVPGFVPLPTRFEVEALIEAGSWGFPIIYRAADSSGGNETWVVCDRSGLQAAFRDIRSSRGVLVEFIDSRRKDQIFRRWRLFVIGGKIDQYTLAKSRNPIIRHESGIPVPTPPPEMCNEVLRAGEVLGLQVFCADVVQEASGRWAIVDVNPTYTYSSEGIHAPGEVLLRRRDHARRVIEYLFAEARK